MNNLRGPTLRLTILFICFILLSAERMTGGASIFSCQSSSSESASSNENNADSLGGYLALPSIASSSGTALSFSESSNNVGLERTINLSFDSEMQLVTDSLTVPLAIIDTSDWLTLSCDDADVTISVTSDDNTIFVIDADHDWDLDQECTLTVLKDGIESIEGKQLEKNLELDFTVVCSPSDDFILSSSLDSCWTFLDEDFFGTIDTMTTEGELTIADAPAATGEEEMMLFGKLLSAGDVDMVAKITELEQGKIIDDSSACIDGEDPNSSTGLCDDGEVDPEDGTPFGSEHPYGTNNFLDSFAIMVADEDQTIGAMFFMGRQNDDEDNITYCTFGEGLPEAAEDFNAELCAVTVSEEEPFYLRLIKDDDTGNLTLKVKSGDDDYTTLGTASIDDLAGENMYVFFAFNDNDEIFCYSAECRAEHGSGGYTEADFEGSLSVVFDSITFYEGSVSNQD
jgi:hypothetical protein